MAPESPGGWGVDSRVIFIATRWMSKVGSLPIGHLMEIPIVRSVSIQKAIPRSLPEGDFPQSLVYGDEPQPISVSRI